MDSNSQNVRMNICFGCMKPLKDGQFICQACGHNNSQRCNPEDALPEGSVLNGKYLVGTVLGRGGFGVTYLGFELNLQIRVAIKEFFPMGMSSRSSQNYSVISSATVENEAFSKGCAAFLDEARTLAVINSPYVVHVRDYFREHSTAYLIMDFVEGKTLAEEMKESGGRISPKRLFALINPMILEIEKLHKRNIIHRDIAPDNLIIVRDELTGEEHLVLLDFGAARSFVSSQISQRYTATVKAGFAPLEQYSQKSKQGPYTDVYALCATMYYTLTGIIPPSALERSADGAEIQSLKAFGIEIPEYIEQAIIHGLVQNSENRTQTMRQLYEELTTPPDENTLKYNAAAALMDAANTEEDYKKAQDAFVGLGEYKNAAEQAEKCREKAKDYHNRALYAQAKDKMAEATLSSYKDAAKKLEEIGDWQDALQQLDYCRLKIKELSGGNKPKVKILPIVLSVLIAVGAIAFALLRKPVTVTDNARVEELEQQVGSLTAERDEALKKAGEAEEARLAAESALKTANEALVDAQAEAGKAKSEAERLKAEQEKAEAEAKAKAEEAEQANADAAEAKRLAEEARAAAEAAERKSAEDAGKTAKEMEEALQQARAVAEAAEKRAAEAEAKAEAKADEASKAKEQAEAATESADSAKAQAEAAEKRAAEALEAKDAAEQKAAEATEEKNAAEQKAAEAAKAKAAAEQRADEAAEAKAAAEQRADKAAKEKEELVAKEEQRKKEEYDKAVGLYHEGNYEAAKMAFEKLEDYLDSQKYAKRCSDAIAEQENAARLKAQIPSIVSVELDEANNPTVTWHALEGVDYYSIYRSEDDQSYTNLNINTKETSCTIKSCKEGQEYFFKVRAKFVGSDFSEFSEAVSISIPEKVPVENSQPVAEEIDNQETLYLEAKALFEGGRYQEAEEAFEGLEDYKDSVERLAEVRYHLGLSYETGSSGLKNERLALSYYQLSADDGNADAINKLGECAYYGVGRTQDYDAAFKLFEQASDLGSIKALYNLALCYQTGNGAEKDTVLAASYYMLAEDAERNRTEDSTGKNSDAENSSITLYQGADEKPQSSNDSSSGGMIVPPENLNPDTSAVNLDVEKDSNGKYVLTINGSILAWGQSIESAAQFCNQNGLTVRHLDNDVNKDAYTLDQNILFGGTIDVSNAFYIRHAANSSELIQIDLHNESRCDENTALQNGQNVYQKLQHKFGTPDNGVRLYVNGEWSDFGSNQLSEAVNKLINSETDYGCVYVNYKNLSLHIVRYTDKKGPYYRVEMSLGRR